MYTIFKLFLIILHYFAKAKTHNFASQVFRSACSHYHTRHIILCNYHISLVNCLATQTFYLSIVYSMCTCITIRPLWECTFETYNFTRSHTFGVLSMQEKQKEEVIM